jgi:hypothetical protein
MAKKSRRARKSARKVSRSAPVVAAASPKPEAEGEPTADRNEYAYVVADIRQVGILAAAMFALLIGLSFFIG